MIKINIVAVGKVKEKYFLEGIEEYSKRLSRFCEFKITEIQEESIKNTQDGDISVIKDREGERILSALKGYVVVMAIEGKKIDSVGLSKTISSLMANGVSCITFVIGGSDGLSDKVKKKADILLSVSDMTFPHTLFRLMLTEQIYRAFTIIEGIKYHK